MPPAPTAPQGPAQVGPSGSPPDHDLFREVVRRRAAGEDFRDPLGELCGRWKSAAQTVVRRVFAAYGRASDDVADVFQDAVAKLVDRGLDQFHGQSTLQPGAAASPRVFFLRIVKHAAIDRCRRRREELAVTEHVDTGAGPGGAAEALVGVSRASQRVDAAELYWKAFENLKTEHPGEAAAWELYHHQDVDDHGEVARLLQISVASSYKRVSRAQAYLRLYLLDLLEPEGRS